MDSTDTRGFLDAVLPKSGNWWFAAWPMPTDGKGTPFAHRAHNDLDALTNDLLQLSARGEQTYFALAGFEQDQYLDANGKRRRRTQENAQYLRSAFLDIDCGKRKKPTPYTTIKDGLQALAVFLKDAALPTPTYLNSSGYGLHAYWAFDEDVSVETWRLAARKLQALCTVLGLEVDSSVTTDASSVLRPVGTTNWKNPDDPKLVRTVRAGKVVSFDTWVDRLDQALDAHDITVSLNPSAGSSGTGINDEFSANLTSYNPSDADKIAERCAVFREMKAHQGANQGYHAWQLSLCTLNRTVQGAEVCHEWSRGHEDYDEGYTNDQLAYIQERQYKPPSCEKFRSVVPETCKGCPETCGNPIKLGEATPGHVASVTLADGTRDEVGELPEPMKDKFRWTGTRLEAWIEPPPKSKATPGWYPCCSQFPKVDYIWRDEDGEFMMHVLSRVKPGEWIEGDISFGSMSGSGPLMRDLAAKVGVVHKHKAQESLEHYMRTWIDHTRSLTDLKHLYQCLGWQEDGSFLLGANRYRPDGKVTKALVSSKLQPQVEAHRVKGDFDEYVRLIDQLYNRPDREIYQFALIASYASALVSLIHPSPLGLMTALVGSMTGRGKTTIAQIGLGVWGNPFANDAQYITGKNATEVAMSEVLGKRRHLPTVIDEITDWTAEEVSRRLYDWSGGIMRLRGKASGGLQDSSKLNWSSVIFITSNKSPIDQLNAFSENAGPQTARIFEVTMPDITLDTADFSLIEDLMRNFHGIGGDKFLRYVVPRRDIVTAMVNHQRQQLVDKLNLSPSERYWVMLVACVRVAFFITRKLGLHQFNSKVFNAWLTARLLELRERLTESYRDPEDQLNDLLAKIMPGMIVTTNLASHRKGAFYASGFGPPRVSVTGRIVDRDKNPLMFVPIKVVKTWANDNKVDYGTLRSELIKKGFIIDANARFNLTTGLPIAGTRTRCWQLNYYQCKNIAYVVKHAGLRAEQIEEVTAASNEAEGTNEGVTANESRP